MKPPSFYPPGKLQLIEVIGDDKKLVAELDSSQFNRERINNMRLDMLMLDPTKQLVVTENNAWI